MPAPSAPSRPEWSDWDTNATYISILNVNGENYTIKDSQARANITANKYDIELLKQTVTGGVHFRGITVTEITDGESGKTLYDKDGNSWPQPGLETSGAQQVGDIFIYNNGEKNLEFIVVAVEDEGHTSYKYSEFGSTGTLGALAFADTASGTATVPLSSNITFNTFTPAVSKGDLAVDTSSVTIELGSTDVTADVHIGDVTVNLPDVTVDVSYVTDSFTALSEVSYDAQNEVLTISSSDSEDFVTGVTGKIGHMDITGDGPTATVTYSRATMSSVQVLSSAVLTGDVSVGDGVPSATITNPTIRVTVSPNAAS